MKLHTPGKPDMETTPKIQPWSEVIEIIDLILKSGSKPDYHLDAAKQRLKELRKKL